MNKEKTKIILRYLRLYTKPNETFFIKNLLTYHEFELLNIEGKDVKYVLFCLARKTASYSFIDSYEAFTIDKVVYNEIKFYERMLNKNEINK